MNQPLTCAFGTRLDPDALLEGIDGVGLGTGRLLIDDEGVQLMCADPDPGRDDVARALTWLRSQLSPLTPIRATKDAKPAGPRLVDSRQTPTSIVSLVEVTDPDRQLEDATRELLQRLASSSEARHDSSDSPGETPRVVAPGALQGVFAGLAERLAGTINSHSSELLGGSSPTLSALVPGKGGHQFVGSPSGPGPHFVFWLRPGGERGVRQAMLVAAAWSQAALAGLGRLLTGGPPGRERLLLDGLVWRVARRPTVAALPLASGDSGASLPLYIDPDRCTNCDVCSNVCPEKCLTEGTPVPTLDAAACTSCYDCVEACPVDAIRPTYGPRAGLLSTTLSHRPGWLGRLIGGTAPAFPAPFPPSFLLPRASDSTKPRYVLGLAVMTMQEHAAVLLRDGRVVGAIEQERLVRVRHAGWHPEGRPGITACVDPTICLEETLCRRPIRALLEQAGITLDDIDVIAVNGIHGRYVDHISFVDSDAPLPKVRAGRVVYVPHHLCHAASAYRGSGADKAWVLSMDGRGDRECAAVFRAEGTELRMVDTILALNDRSIGGVYEGVTRVLGFGSHGQGTVMALGAFGKPTVDMSQFLQIDAKGQCVHEGGISSTFASLTRTVDDPVTAEHHNLASSLQQALERSAEQIVRRNAGDGPIDGLCLAGGVALNCRMNEHLRQVFKPEKIFAQPAANDAGTALGAAFEAWADLSGSNPEPLNHAYFGPAFDDEAIETVLRHSGLQYSRAGDIARETAKRLADGEVVCWFQGNMEYGPRALGARSILADPRNVEHHTRVNDIKHREHWRPFAPSILAGHESDWLEDAFDARYMLFTSTVKESKRAQIPAVVHVDGTTRPQVVHREAPLYHDLISEFHRLTEVPMVLNTSFNRRGEPLVCTPDDALEAFRELKADVLAIGSFLVERTRSMPTELAESEYAELAELPGGRRLSLRLTQNCDFDCGHCTLRDQPARPDRSFDEALRCLSEARRTGCDELVIMRGEASLRPDLPKLVSHARRMGFRFVQLQTNAHALAAQAWRDSVLSAGVDAFEVMLVAPTPPLHDALSGTPGSFKATLTAIQALCAAGSDVLISVPVLQGNLRALPTLATLAHKLGARRIQFNFPRPVELVHAVVTEPIPRLGDAAPYVAKAGQRARELGLQVTSEAFPLCVLPAEFGSGTEARVEWQDHRIDDLHLLHTSLEEVHKAERPVPPPCRGCRLNERCPKTWALYLELFGSEELTPVSDD